MLTHQLFRLVAAVTYFVATAATEAGIDLSNWKLTLPVGESGSPGEVNSLEGYVYPPYFYHEDDGPYVFVTPAGGVTTSGSHYPRTELREMNGTDKAKWSTTSGAHIMLFEASVQRMTPVKPDIVVGQIHDADDDVLQIRLRKGQAQIAYLGDSQQLVVAETYILGTRFQVKVIASDGYIQVFYDDMATPAVTYPYDNADCYFKLGNYLQSNPDKGEDPEATGEVWVYSASLQHCSSISDPECADSLSVRDHPGPAPSPPPAEVSSDGLSIWKVVLPVVILLAVVSGVIVLVTIRRIKVAKRKLTPSNGDKDNPREHFGPGW